MKHKKNIRVIITARIDPEIKRRAEKFVEKNSLRYRSLGHLIEYLLMQTLTSEEQKQ